MNADRDDLSRLLDGELPPAEAEALRARIATDPVLAARWEVLQGLPARLGALPKALSPPSDLQPLGAGGAPPQRPPVSSDGRVRSLLPRLGWLAAAAAAAVVLLRPEPTHVLVSGTEVVTGRAEVLAGDVAVVIDGVARVTVEPPAASGREVVAEIDPMNVSHLAAAAAGSIVTVTVYEGSARLRPDDTPVEVHAGETRSVTADPEDDERVRPRPTDRRAGRTAAKGAPVGEAARVAELEREVARLERERALATGRARRGEGQPVPWPSDVRPAFRPEAFEHFVEDRVAGLPDAEVAAVDCEEFPCVAVIESLSDAPDWEERLAPVHEDLEAAGFGDSLQVMGLASETRSEEGDLRLYAFTIAPPDLTDDAKARLQARAKGALEDLAGM